MSAMASVTAWSGRQVTTCVVMMSATRRPSTPGSSGGPPPRPDTIAGLPPGEYFAVAVDDLDSELMRDGDVLERLSRGARRVTLSEDAKIDVSLRRVKLSDLIADR